MNGQSLSIKRYFKKYRWPIVIGLCIFLTILATTFFVLKEKEKSLRIKVEEELSRTIQEKEKVEQDLSDTIIELNTEKQRAKELTEELTEEKRRREAIAVALDETEKELEEERRLRVEAEKRLEVTQGKLKLALKSNEELKEKVNELSSKQIIELEKIVVTPNPPLEGRILVVNREFEFVVINLGKEDNLRLGALLGVYRDEEIIAKVRVEKVFDKISAATILHQLNWPDISENDVVREL